MKIIKDNSEVITGIEIIDVEAKVESIILHSVHLLMWVDCCFDKYLSPAALAKDSDELNYLLKMKKYVKDQKISDEWNHSSRFSNKNIHVT